MQNLEAELRTQSAGRSSWYLTTAIPYVNGPPHVGFALELIQADVLARHRRSEGYSVRLQAGTDENSLKNVLAAQALGMDTRELVRKNADRFIELKPALNLSIDDHIRTSTDPHHRIGVEKLWHACLENGDIYRKEYTGLYCVGCEQFYQPADLRDGKCPEHGTRPEEVTEENYFFRLSRYWDKLLNAVSSGRLRIEPASRRKEVLRWIEGGLEDFSISRSAARARGWGIPVPGDPGQVIYVWFDALANYVTALGYGTDGADFTRYWCTNGTREHVIGKGVTRFHAVYWPAILLSAGLPLPTGIFVHGYVTVDGAKIGKSAGNAVDPIPLAREFGVDALRYYLLRYIRSTEDGDFTRERFLQAYQTDLADQLGNLAHRVLSMIDRYLGGIVPHPALSEGEPGTLLPAVQCLPALVAERTGSYAFQQALEEIWSVIALANRYVTVTEPWALARIAQSSPASAESRAALVRLNQCLFELAHALCVVGRCLAPYLPSTSERILKRLAADTAPVHIDNGESIAGNRILKMDVLFPKTDH